MSKILKTFLSNEDGAVTVDWVVLTAAIVGLAVGVIALISAGALDYSTSVGNELSGMTIATY
ncbi:hypothetical protein IV417_01125 [Alphaproteobacteria bacterium KMM 3653]|uniref:Pilus assembly protein n=1 Tax=Harenicola maris TaxID=2841044 RepID=A0AAP2CK99_9RHOB|nr:hypothetical protein [Harenicola maris]